VARSVNAADSRMVNLYPEATPAPEGNEPAYLNRAPGLRKLATVGTGPIRGLWSYGDYGYAVSGARLYRIDTSWNVTPIGGVSGTGPVSMVDNGTQLFIAANPDGYIYDAATEAYAEITDVDFPGAVTVGYLDGYFIFQEPNSDRFWTSELLDGTQIDPLSFASAEGMPDKLISLFVDHREVWLFGTQSVEVWYDAGTTPFPLARIQGAVNELGCAATYSVAKMDNSLFWLGADARGQGIVFRAQGYSGQRVSTHAVEYAIQSYGTISDAIGFTYQQDGHSFYVLTFPTAQKTWVFDMATQAWHERAGFANGEFIRHRANCQMFFNNEVVVGDFQNGKIYAYDLDVFADDNLPQKWLRSWRALPTGQNTLKRTAQHTLQLECETGVGLTGNSQHVATIKNILATQTNQALLTENGAYIVANEIIASQYVQGSDPQIMLRWSDDGGHTWSNEHWTGMGKIGNYGYRAFWRRLGMTDKLRDRVYEVSGTDPVKIAIMGAELVLTGTNA